MLICAVVCHELRLMGSDVALLHPACLPLSFFACIHMGSIWVCTGATLTQNHFTEAEDYILAEFLRIVPPDSCPRVWSKAAWLLPGRSGRQCRDR